MFAFPHVVQWFRDVLPTLEPDLSKAREHELIDGVQTPKQQLDDILHDFIAGEDLDVYGKAHAMRPDALGIWELKTIDLRLFGWVYCRCCFIIANVDSGFNCKDKQLYTAYRDDTNRRREAINLDEPKYLTGGYSHVF